MEGGAVGDAAGDGDGMWRGQVQTRLPSESTVSATCKNVASYPRS